MTRNTKIWCLVLPAMCLPLIASLFYFVWFREGATAQFLYSATKLFTVAWPIFAVRFVLRDALPDLRVASFLRPLVLFRGIGIGLIISVIMVASLFTPLGTHIIASVPMIREQLTVSGIINHFLFFAIFLSVLHSLIEEYYWRWLVFGKLREVVSLPLAHVLAALSFAAHHCVVASQFFSPTVGIPLGLLVGFGGACWSILYQRDGVLTGAWVSHMTVDITIMVIGSYLLF